MRIVRRSGRPPRRSGSLARLVLVIAAVTLVVAVPARAANPSTKPVHVPPPPGLAEFMGGLAQIESGGRYDVRNKVSGAFGKYQIMPFNWPSWAGRYLGSRKAKPTPANQERVAAGRLSELYLGLGSWDRTAYWWLTGKHGPRETWSKYASHYVDGVMLGYRVRSATPPPGGSKRLDDAGGIVRYAGDWKVARYRRYLDGAVHYAKAPGAAVGIRFVGRGIRIVGPKGPTRGRVAVYLDGRKVGVVELRTRAFHARATLVSLSWAKRGEHWVELRVVKTPGHRVVAVDSVTIRG
jgi:hypothetical protein